MDNPNASTTNITELHMEAFEALRDPEYGNFALFSCFLNGEPTCAISAITEDGPGQYHITPIFVAVTDGMVLTDHDGVPSKES